MRLPGRGQDRGATQSGTPREYFEEIHRGCQLRRLRQGPVLRALHFALAPPEQAPLEPEHPACSRRCRGHPQAPECVHLVPQGRQGDPPGISASRVGRAFSPAEGARFVVPVCSRLRAPVPPSTPVPAPPSAPGPTPTVGRNPPPTSAPPVARAPQIDPSIARTRSRGQVPPEKVVLPRRSRRRGGGGVAAATDRGQARRYAPKWSQPSSDGISPSQRTPWNSSTTRPMTVHPSGTDSA